MRVPPSYLIAPQGPPVPGTAFLMPWYAEGGRGWMGIACVVLDHEGQVTPLAQWERPPEVDAGPDYMAVLTAFAARCRAWCDGWNAGGPRGERVRRAAQ